jgi:uncharacterized Zn finger protein (UPF0148 family)
MGLFRKIKPIPVANSLPSTNPSDARVAACPNCGVSLKKVPGAKTKCPDCSELMYVRTDPQSNNRVVVTFDQAQEIDDEWAKLNGTWPERKAERERVNVTRERLAKKWNVQTASDKDVQWAMRNEDLVAAIRDGKWEAYQKALFELGLEIHDTKKPDRALPIFILAAFLYINNPDDAFGGWSPTTYVPGAAEVFDYVALECELLGITPEDGLTMYSERAQREGQKLKVPVLWSDAHKMILENIALGK